MSDRVTIFEGMGDREAIWRRIWCEVAAFDDIGRKVDPGIYALVVALRAHGCPTFSSCEGHTVYGPAQPSVLIRLPGATSKGKEDETARPASRPARPDQRRPPGGYLLAHLTRAG